MTEVEWNECADSERMLRFLGGKPGDRKLRLFAVACCRRALAADVEIGGTQEESVALSTAEAFADGIVSKRVLRDERAKIGGVGSYSSHASLAMTEGGVLEERADRAASIASRNALDYFGHRRVEANGFDWDTFQQGRSAENAAQSAILRCIVGPLPFRPITLEGSSFKVSVKMLAESIYDAKDFTKMPILADILEEAGCTNQDILEHCRGPGPHSRGCWVVDLLLERN